MHNRPGEIGRALLQIRHLQSENNRLTRVRFSKAEDAASATLAGVAPPSPPPLVNHLGGKLVIAILHKVLLDD